MGKTIKVIGVLLVIVLGLILYKPYLLSAVVLGNDLAVSLESEQRVIDIVKGENKNIELDFYALTNPLCNVNCKSNFVDLETGQVKDTKEFKLKAYNTGKHIVEINVNSPGQGKKFYRFEVSCISENSLLCNSNGKERSRELLIIGKYNMTEDEKKIINESSFKIAGYLNKAYEINDTLNYYNTLSISNDIKPKINNVLLRNNLFIYYSENAMGKLAGGDYLSMSSELDKLSLELKAIEPDYEEIKENMNLKVNVENSLLFELDVIESKLIPLADRNYSKANADKISSFVLRYNSLGNDVNKTRELSKDIDNAVIDVANDSSHDFAVNVKINKPNVNGFKLNPPPQRNVSLANFNGGFDGSGTGLNSGSRCCLFGNCSSCSGNGYPLLLIHGHDFTRDVSSEYALDYLSAIQRGIEKEGYLNAGPLLIGNFDEKNKGILSSQLPISVRSSFYFDIYKNSENTKLIETKADNIDSYAIRLKDIIDVMVYETGKDKIDIVAHSMGGLVVRRYIQIFGVEKINRVILIGTPNNGIDSATLSYCTFFGAEKECNDMAQDSLLISKLQSMQAITIPVYNIIGEGCVMGSTTGDGIVTKESAELKGAENIYMTGKCDSTTFKYFHVDITNPNEYPEVYNKIVEILKGK